MVDEYLFIELIIHSNGNWLYVYHTLPEGPLDLEALGLSLHSLLVNPALSAHNLRVTTQKLISQCSVFRSTLLFVMKQKQDALLVYHKWKFCLHEAFKTFMLAIPATKTVEFCAFVCLKKQTQCRKLELFNNVLLINYLQLRMAIVQLRGSSGGQIWNRGARSSNGGSGTTGPPAGDGHGLYWNKSGFNVGTLLGVEGRFWVWVI